MAALALSSELFTLNNWFSMLFNSWYTTQYLHTIHYDIHIRYFQCRGTRSLLFSLYYRVIPIFEEFWKQKKRNYDHFTCVFWVNIYYIVLSCKWNTLQITVFVQIFVWVSFTRNTDRHILDIKTLILIMISYTTRTIMFWWWQ